MKKLFAALAFLAVSSSAYAQSMKIEIDPGKMGMGVQMDVNHADMTVTQSSSQVSERTEDGYKLRYESQSDGRTKLQVLAPEGARVEIWDGQTKLADEDIPVSVSARPDAFHRIIIHGRNGEIWEKKLSTKQGSLMSLWVAAPNPVQQVTMRTEIRHEPPPPPPPPAPMQVGMGDSDFAALKEAISGESFSSDQLNVLRSAASRARFSADQVGEIIDIFPHSSDKLEALSVVKNKIEDRNNNFKIFKHFTFSSDKEKAQGMLR